MSGAEAEAGARRKRVGLGLIRERERGRERERPRARKRARTRKRMAERDGDQLAGPVRWAHQDLNLGPTGYEPAALTAELWALRPS